MLAANFFWIGSEAEIQGIRPSYFYNYNENVPLVTRVEQVKKWLEMSPEHRPHLISLYFSDVDVAGHAFGPRSEQVKDAVLKVDDAISKLMVFLNASHLPINVVIVSDNGMEATNPSDVEYLDDYTNLSSVRAF